MYRSSLRRNIWLSLTSQAMIVLFNISVYSCWSRGRSLLKSLSSMVIKSTRNMVKCGPVMQVHTLSVSWKGSFIISQLEKFVHSQSVGKVRSLSVSQKSSFIISQPEKFIYYQSAGKYLIHAFSLLSNVCTVKPVCKDHTWKQQNVVFVYNWSLVTDQISLKMVWWEIELVVFADRFCISGLYSQVVFNTGLTVP